MLLSRTKNAGTIFYALTLLLFFTIQAFAQHSINVDVNQVLNDVSAHPVGINVNYLMDDTYLLPSPAQTTQEALKSMGVKFLRYPGGEKSDNYLWSISPWEKALPTVARTGSAEWPSSDSRFTESDQTTLKSSVLDFDEFISICQAIGAEPIIVVAYDCMYKPAATSTGIVPTKEQLLKNAEEWVRYANVLKNYRVKYWMIGNESYNDCDYNGCATASQYRDDVIAFSQRMKSVDPTIKIIANGDNDAWWASVLPSASTHIDYLGLSNYPIWNYSGGYEYYRTRTPDFMKIVQTAEKAIQTYAPITERKRLKIITTEFNSIDWSGTWQDNNDLGHALVSFEILGEHLKNPLIECTNFWNTRWVNNATTSNHIYDALNKNGDLNANGRAIAIWGNYLLNKMIATTSTRAIRSFATLAPDTQKLNILLVNKEASPQKSTLSLMNYVEAFTGKRWEFSGTGPGDISPTWVPTESFTVNGNVLSLQLPAVSITVLELTPVAAAEICDGIDNDKDGHIDEGLLFTTYYKDADGDTYGDPNNFVSACTQPANYVANSLDCNDSNAQIRLGTIEICSNNMDDNCDGNIDETCSSCTATGTILREYWANITGTSVSAIPLNTTPTSTSQLTSFESPTNVANSYGQRVRGYVCAPATGNYTFFIAGDDNAELWLSTDEKASNKRKIASVSSWTNAKEWRKFASQKSAAISLQAGKKYYIEALQKEGTSGDNLAVGWQLPNSTTIAVIPGAQLSPFTTATSTNQPPTVSIISPASNAAYVAPASVTINATAADANGTVSRVEFYNGATKLGEDLTSPYGFTWSKVGVGIYSLTAKAIDNIGATTTSSAVSITISSGPVMACSGTGSISREVWTSILGKTVTTIPTGTAPNSTGSLTSFQAPSNQGSNYGQRIRGYVCVGVSGSYTFYISSDDNSELYISPDADPAKKARIAYVNGWTNALEWSKFTTQKSASITLTAGVKYYIEALHKEDASGDHLAVGWQLPNSATIAVIPGAQLSPFSTSTARLSNEQRAESTGLRLKIYPNPSLEDKLQVDVAGLDTAEEVSFILYNSIGSIVMTKTGKADEGGSIQQEIHFASRLSAGIYILCMQAKSKTLREKIYYGAFR